MSEREVRLVYDCVLKRPACALIQAALGGDYLASQRLGFDAWCWLVSPSPGMRLIAGTEDEWRLAAEITRAEMARLAAHGDDGGSDD